MNKLKKQKKLSFLFLFFIIFALLLIPVRYISAGEDTSTLTSDVRMTESGIFENDNYKLEVTTTPDYTEAKTRVYWSFKFTRKKPNLPLSFRAYKPEVHDSNGNPEFLTRSDIWGKDWDEKNYYWDKDRKSFSLKGNSNTFDFRYDLAGNIADLDNMVPGAKKGIIIEFPELFGDDSQNMPIFFNEDYEKYFDMTKPIHKAELLTEEYENKATDISTYNLYLTGFHWMAADAVEGASAIQGNIYMSKTATNNSKISAPNYGSDTVHQRISLILGGRVFNPFNLNETADHTLKVGQDTTPYGFLLLPQSSVVFSNTNGQSEGWYVKEQNNIFVTSENIQSGGKLDKQESGLKYLPDKQFDNIFNQLEFKKNRALNKLNKLVKPMNSDFSSSLKFEIKGLRTIVNGVPQDYYQGQYKAEVPYEVHEVNDKYVAVLYLDQLKMTFNDYNSIKEVKLQENFLPFISNEIERISVNGKSISSAVIYSTKDKFIYTSHSAGMPANAGKITYYLPNATQVTTFRGKNNWAPDLKTESFQESNLSTGQNPFYKENENLYQYGGSIFGSLIAPKADVAIRNSINGQIWCKNFYQMTGSKSIHAKNELLEDFIKKDEPDGVDFEFEKIDGLTGKLLTGANFKISDDSLVDASKPEILPKKDLNGRETGEYLISNMKEGHSYSLSEINAPENYFLSKTTWKLYVDKSGKVTLKKVDNNKQKSTTNDVVNGKLRVKNWKIVNHSFLLTDEENNTESLTGAKFTIQLKDKIDSSISEIAPQIVAHKPVYGTSTGIFILKNLVVGQKYILKQSDTVSGYDGRNDDGKPLRWELTVTSETIKVKGLSKKADQFLNPFNEADNMYDFHIINPKLYVLTPHTGGSGIIKYIIWGITIFSLGAILFTVVKIKQRWSSK